VVDERESVLVRNRIDSPVAVAELLLIGADGTQMRVPFEKLLGPGEEQEAAVKVQNRKVLPVYTLVRSTTELTEIRDFMEDITVNAVFINLIDFGAHGLAALRIVCKVKGLEGDRNLELTDVSPIASAEFLLSLTTYLSDPTVDFQVTAVPREGVEIGSPWRSWRLITQGSVIGVTWDIMQST
jgi:hypothetical protein